jgi:hypothetical protein
LSLKLLNTQKESIVFDFLGNSYPSTFEHPTVKDAKIPIKKAANECFAAFLCLIVFDIFL